MLTHGDIKGKKIFQDVSKGGREGGSGWVKVTTLLCRRMRNMLRIMSFKSKKDFLENFRFNSEATTS